MSEEGTTFETSYAELEQLVTRLQDGGLSLEESLALFERGMHLARLCQEQLTEAALRMSRLLDDGSTTEIEGPQGEV